MRKNILFAFGVLVAASCVNKEYDITKPIDTTMNVGGQIEMPVPGESSYSYTLGDILLPDDAAADGVLKKLDNGSFCLVIEPSEGINEKYTFGQITAADYAKNDSHTFVALESAIGQEVDYPVSVPLNLQVSGIDGSVETIREADLDALLTLAVETVGGTRISIKSGYKFTLPEFIYIDESTLPSFAEIDAAAKSAGHRNVIVIKEAQTFDGVFSLSCHINKLELSNFGISEGIMHIAGDATAEGKIAFMKFALSDGVQFPLETIVKITGVKATSVTMKASPTIVGEDQAIQVGEVPEALNDIDFELADVGLFVSVKNETPFTAAISANISAFSGGNYTDPVAVRPESGFSVASNTAGMNFCLSDSGEYGTAADRKIKLPGLAGLVSPVPEKLQISGIRVTGSAASEDGFVTVAVGKEYHLGLSYRIEAPLSFRSLTLKRDENIDVNLDLGDDISFDDLFIKATFTNTLPLDAVLTFDIVDGDGNAVQGVSLKYEDENGNGIDALVLSAGSIETPSSGNLKLVAVADDGSHISKIQSLRLHIVASSPENSVVTLNAAQSLSVSNIIVGTNSGIFIDGNKNSDENE